MKIDEVKLNKEYWFFLLIVSNSGRISRKENIRKVKVLSIKRRGYNPDTKWIVDANDPNIVIYTLNYGSANGLYETYEEAKTEWNRIIENNLDFQKSKYEKINKNLQKKLLK